MKRAILGLCVCFTLITTVAYLCGAFAEASFNIASWNRSTRANVALSAGMVSIFCWGIERFFSNTSDEGKK
jgi:uncharacterized membrane protein